MPTALAPEELARLDRGEVVARLVAVPGSGNVASARGSFTLTPRGPAGTLVVFRTATDTGDATPRFLLDRALLDSLPWVLDGLRQQVNRCRYTEPFPEGCREERPWTGAAAPAQDRSPG